jgi:hypothetical protein
MCGSVVGQLEADAVKLIAGVEEVARQVVRPISTA